MSRPTLAGLRAQLLFELDDEWRTATELTRALGFNGAGHTWYKVALVCERLVVDGQAEIKRPGSRTRRFRLRSGA
jgi:hypothetical protein